MRRRVDRIVIFPRYTAFVGTEPLYSAPLDMRNYAHGVFVGAQGTGIGLTPAEVEYTMQLSPDLENWVDIDTISPSAGGEASGDMDFRHPWMRWRADLAGADPGVTSWLVGDVVWRDGLPGGGA